MNIKTIVTTGMLFLAGTIVSGQTSTNQVKEKNMEKLELVKEWDKVFPQSSKVVHEKVTFRNRYGITLAADMYIPKNAEGKLAAIAVSGPFGAVKEQSSGLYAQTLAERGFLTIAFDPSYTGESGGQPRYVASPDINTEDFLAAVDYLSCRDDVDPNRVGIIGICGWGGLALNAAALDPRIKATVACTMYDMSRIACKGYFDANDSAAERMRQRRMFSAQRTEDYKAGSYKRAGGVVDPLPDDARRAGLLRRLRQTRRLLRRSVESGLPVRFRPVARSGRLLLRRLDRSEGRGDLLLQRRSAAGHHEDRTHRRGVAHRL